MHIHWKTFTKQPDTDGQIMTCFKCFKSFRATMYEDDTWGGTYWYWERMTSF